MRHTIKRYLSPKTAFTIVELVVVIAVIGILAVIVVVSYRSVVTDTNQKNAESALLQAKMKLSSFKADNGRFPVNQTEFSDATANTASLSWTGNAQAYCISIISEDNKTYNATDATDPTQGECETVTGVPDKPTISGNTPSTTSLAVTWSSIPDTTSYTLQYSTNLSFTSPQSTSTGSTSATISGLSTATIYYLRLAAINDEGQSGWSSTVTAATLPTAPSIALTPSRCDMQPDFRWNIVGTSMNYQVQISLDSGFTAPSSELITPTTDPSNIEYTETTVQTNHHYSLPNNTTWWGRVATVGPLGQLSAWSNVLNYTAHLVCY